MKTTKKIMLLLILVSVFVSIIRIVASASMSTSGIDLTKLQTDTQAIEDENTSLRQDLYAVSSLTYVYEKAKEEGFIDSGKSITLSSPVPVAYKQ